MHRGQIVLEIGFKDACGPQVKQNLMGHRLHY